MIAFDGCQKRMSRANPLAGSSSHVVTCLVAGLSFIQTSAHVGATPRERRKVVTAVQHVRLWLRTLEPPLLVHFSFEHREARRNADASVLPPNLTRRKLPKKRASTVIRPTSSEYLR